MHYMLTSHHHHWLSFTMIKYNDGAMEVGHALCAAKNTFTKSSILNYSLNIVDISVPFMNSPHLKA